MSLESYFKVSLEKELEKSSTLKIEDIADIQQWIATQPDIPLCPGRFTKCLLYVISMAGPFWVVYLFSSKIFFLLLLSSISIKAKYH